MRKIGFLTTLLLFAQLVLQPISASAAGAQVISETVLTPAITGVGNIWTGKIPTKVSFPTNTYCPNLSFPIQGLLPISVLSDRALGVSVEFEIWSSNGRRTSSNTIYSSSWNPTGPNTEASISLPYQCAGTYTLIVRTIYETKSNGLITSYLKDEKKLSVEFIGGATQTSNVATIQTTQNYTSAISLVGSIWSAGVPTAITLPESSYSSYLEFQVTSLQPYADLADRSTGTSIEFEIWDKSGKQVASDTLSSYDWNPITASTLVSIYLGSDVGAGSYTFIYRTIYKTSSNGLLSNYLKAESNSPLVISGKARPKVVSPQIVSSIDYVSVIAGVGNIWSSSLPKLVQLPEGSSSKLEFNITGLLPISVLTDRALGVDVDFEIWSSKGVKIASETVYSSDWNSKGPNTLVSMYIFSDRFNVPTTLRVVTTYATRSNGLLTSYLEDVDNFPITVLGNSTAASESGKITSDSNYVANIKSVGDIWRGAIPTEVALPTSGYSKDVEFQIEGLLPYKTLANQSLGVTVEFEIWSDAGEKIGSDKVYASEWNPVGPRTLVTIRLPSEIIADTFTLLVKTTYETDTNGLLTSYFETKLAQKLKITGGGKTLNQTHRIVDSRPVTASITGVGNIWSGNVPSKIALNPYSGSSEIAFQIQAVLPYATVADLSTGTSIEFEVWSSGGKKVTYETVYSSDWNPVGVKTLVKMYVWSDMTPASYTLIVRTIYKTRTNGLLSNYLKDEKSFPFVVVDSGKISEISYFWDVQLSQKSISGINSKFSSTNKSEPIFVTSSTPLVCSVVNSDLMLKKKGTCIIAANQKGTSLLFDSPERVIEFEVLTAPPANVDKISADIVEGGIKLSWTAPVSDEKISKYEIGIATTKSSNLSATSSSSYFQYKSTTSTSENNYLVTSQEILDFYISQKESSGLTGIHLRLAVRAVSDAGSGQFYSWIYITADQLASLIWSKNSTALTVEKTSTGGRNYFSATKNLNSITGLTGKPSSYSWRVSFAPAGSDFATFNYNSNGTEFLTTISNSVEENLLLAGLDGLKSTFPLNGAVLIFAVGLVDGKRSLDFADVGLYSLTESLITRIESAKATLIAEAKAAAELKAKQEAEAAKILADAKAKANSLTKKTSITCTKGKLIKKVTGINPKCPTGYKVKR
jgi:hypothetical protein